jgi:hypothetical protein
MGLLTVGEPMHWDDAKKHADFIRAHGIAQFMNIYNELKGRRQDDLLWGDEVCQWNHMRGTVSDLLQGGIPAGPL